MITVCCPEVAAGETAAAAAAKEGAGPVVCAGVAVA